MKCFFYQALKYFGHVPEKCIIDNTSLVIDRGSGHNAIFNKEMIDFAKGLHFEWYAHAIKHSDRKAGVERGFRTIETNFFPGREFNSLEDLNQQALNWCQDRSKKMNKRKFIPFDRFEYEKDFMSPLSYVMSPYQQFKRVVDQEGYVLHGTNLYWVGIQRDISVIILEFSDHLKIYHNRKEVRAYPLPSYGTRQKKYSPEGVSLPYRPKKRTIPPNDEERELKKSALVEKYLDFSLASLGPQQRYQFIRHLFHLYKNLTPMLFEQTIQRALKYKVTKKSSLERIAIYLLGKDELVIPNFEFDALYGQEPELGIYDAWGSDE